MHNITIERLIHGMMIREGAGVRLHRYIGIEKTDEFEPLLLLDYFNSENPMDFMAGFPPHPHRGFETITYLLDGSIVHEDNKGHKGVIGSGAVQWMTAGKGIVHSEMPLAEHGRLHGLQLWLNLPAAEKMREPRYQELSCAELPLEHDGSGAVIKVIAGKTDKGTVSPITGIATVPLFFDITLPLGSSIQQHIPDGYQAVLLVISGTISVDKQSVPQGVLAKLSAGNLLTLAAEKNSQCLLIGAAKLHEPIVRHGPFVMNTPEEIKQALHDFRHGKF